MTGIVREGDEARGIGLGAEWAPITPGWFGSDYKDMTSTYEYRRPLQMIKLRIERGFTSMKLVNALLAFAPRVNRVDLEYHTPRMERGDGATLYFTPEGVTLNRADDTSYEESITAWNVPAQLDVALPRLVKFYAKPVVQVKLSARWTAEIGKTHTKVGCQTFDNSLVLKLAEAIGPRLLKTGDTITTSDEFSMDKGKTWVPVTALLAGEFTDQEFLYRRLS